MKKSYFLGLGMVALLLACAKSRNIDLKKWGAQLKFEDGTTISEDSSDDYNPIVLKKSDDTLILVFGSNRSGNYEIKITETSIAYASDYSLPSFSALSTLNVSSTNVTSANRIYFAANINGANLEILVTDSSTNMTR